MSHATWKKIPLQYQVVLHATWKKNSAAISRRVACNMKKRYRNIQKQHPQPSKTKAHGGTRI
jgi:hypothetical protein